MNPAELDRMGDLLRTQGADAALGALCDRLRADKDYQSLFYAMLARKRHALGIPAVATGNNNDIPPAQLDGFEEGIREACRTVGKLYLDDGQLPQAWGYYRMINEPGPVVEALEKIELPEDADVQPYVDVAFHQGVLPKKGFDWILARYGTCNAITTVSSGQLPFPPDVVHHCIRRLIGNLHDELTRRLTEEIKQKQGFAPTGTSLRELVEGRDWLFADDCYHIDLSHLNAVVQMASQLDPGDDMRRAKDLCAYGKKLSPRYLYHSDPPFENLYADYEIYLGILLGDDVEGGLAHFRKKADDADPETIGTYPAEVLVNLLLRLGRPNDALEVARKHLSSRTDVRHSCPSFVELCQQTGNYVALAAVAREQGNPVNYLAALASTKR